MKKNKYSKLALPSLVLAAALISGCSHKTQEEFNRPADYWYKKMVKETTKGDLEEADKTFTSLQSEHIRSPLLPEAMLIMAEAHISNEQYVLANYYLDEFIKRYGDKKSVEFAKYQKVKANFLAFKKVFRDQQLILETLKDSKAYIAEYPNSIYRPYVETVVLKLTLAEKEMNEYIADLYKRKGKDAASQMYRNDANSSWVEGTKYEGAQTPWHRSFFEVTLR